MTREEAIKTIENRDSIMDYCESAELGEALEMAIKALEQEPIREADDYENEIADLHNRLDIAEYDKERLREEVTALEEKLKALSVEPCEDAISFPKGTLKKRGKGYVVYNPEWLKENWQTELKVMGVECEDAISRDYLLSIANTDGAYGYVSAHDILKAPSVTPKQNWIPVNERLPEVKYDSLGNNISDYVLLWVKKGDYETYKVGYFSPPNYFDAITSDGWFISVCALKDVIAWMSLPEPYKPQESEDKESE